MSFCAKLKTRFVELLKAKQAFDVAYADKSTVTGSAQIERWSVLRKVTKTLRNSRDGLGDPKDLKSNIRIWREIAKGDFMNMNKLTLLSDTAAEHLAKNKSGLRLKGLTELSDTAAEHLSRYKGWLHLSGLTTLSDTAAKYLSTHKGDLAVPKNIQAQIDRF